jgi:hypothetical protein
MVNGRTVILSISGAVICQCVVGCVGAHTFMVSSASIETNYPSEASIGKFMIGSTAVFVRPGNTIRISASEGIIFPFHTYFNADPKGYFFDSFYYKHHAAGTREPFVVEVLLSTGNHDAIFGAMALILKDEKGKESYPESFYNLAPRYSTTRFLNPVTPFCRHPDKLPGSIDYPLLPQYEKTSRDPLRLEKETLYCFAVKFDIPPLDPRSMFTLAINDLSIDGQKVTVPIISFTPDTYVEKTH